MSSTSNVQNLLINVFRPVYTYNTATSNFVPSLEISNVSSVYTNLINASNAEIGDSNYNVYVGSNAGNAYNNTRGCFSNVALGYNAGGSLISNVSNSVYIGAGAGAGASNASNVIAIGKGAIGTGINNIFLGNSTGTLGNSNIFIGHAIAPTNVSNTFRIGTRPLIAGDLSTGWVGFGGITNPTAVGGIMPSQLDVSGYATIVGGLGINNDPTEASLNVNGNFQIENGDTTFTYDFDDTTSNTVMRIAKYDSGCNDPKFISDGYTQSKTGFNSLNNTITIDAGGTSNIATLKKGTILVNVQDTQDATTNYAARMVYCSDPTNGTYVYNLSSNVQAGDPTITFSGSNIRVTNGSGTQETYYWAVTYFPIS